MLNFLCISTWVQIHYNLFIYSTFDGVLLEFRINEFGANGSAHRVTNTEYLSGWLIAASVSAGVFAARVFAGVFAAAVSAGVLAARVFGWCGVWGQNLAW